MEDECFQRNISEIVHLEFLVNVFNEFCKPIVGQFSSHRIQSIKGSFIVWVF